MALSDDVPVITKPSEKCLTERQQMDYRMHREKLLKWISTLGKDPVRAQGYSTATVKRTAYRLDQFF